MAGGRLAACHGFIYDRLYMFRPCGSSCLALLVFLAGSWVLPQSSSKAPPEDALAMARKATALAESGHCAEAFPSLKKSLSQLSDKDLKRKVGLDGVHCAMTLNHPSSAVEFLQVLTREFPQDPEVLYVAVHAYSDLSTLAAQQLAMSAPSSAQAHELLAESFEAQGKWDEAEKEYRAILKQNPKMPGIHFRLGRLLLSRPNPSPTASAEAKREFEQELEIDPSNAGAEYVLGELARQNQQWDEAIHHFTQAAKLDPQFGEAFLGLGISLISEKRYPDAIPPLETAVKLEPKNPDAHYNLATAYTRAGRKPEAEKEFAIHRQLTGADSEAQPPPPAPQQERK
jgi:tetratricopeptide (TPR) repeat protein